MSVVQILKHRTIIGANAAYACADYTWANDTDHHVGSIDFKLPGACGAAAGLRRIAQEHRERAARELRMADVAEALAGCIGT